MNNLMFENLVDNNFSVYVIQEMDGTANKDDVESLFDSIKDIPIKFATIDLGHMNLREFNKTPLSQVLRKFDIPYFTVELPHYVKGHFSSQISEIQNKYNELTATYNSLKNKNAPSAQELGYLIEYYSNELKELNHYINKEVRTNAITKRILDVLKNRETKDLTFIHFGEENTFVEIMNNLKELNVKSNILFIQSSRFIN
ncbi:MAG: hypothetical protein ACW98D_15145 [Promethearchaeota archaeon]|jgi:hypothetical protein